MLSKLRTLLVCTLALAAFCVAQGSAETFRNPLRIPTATDPSIVLVGDLNGDGRPDILWGDSTVSPVVYHILLAQPGGGYAAAANFVLTASTQVQCQLADFNKDGDLDLVCGAGSGLNNLSIQVFLGNGDGTFQAPITTPINSNYANANPAVFVAGDLNGDGLIDLIEADNYGNNVFLGNGKGGFQPGKPLLAGINLIFPVIADLNGDGKPDIFLPYGPGVEMGNGDGTFGPSIDYSNAAYIGATCLLHDMDGDKHLDAVCAAYGGGQSELAILHGNPDGSFNTTPIAVQPVELGHPLAIFDINGDGIPDILTAATDLAVFLGGANLTFNTPAQYAWPFSQYARVAETEDTVNSVIADMNGDGIPDIVASGPNGVYISYSRPDGTIASANAVQVVTQLIRFATVADFNGDGIPDVAATGDTAIKLCLGNGDGTFATPVALPNSNGVTNFGALPSSFGHIIHGDFDGDGHMDLLADGTYTSAGYGSVILFGNGDGTFKTPLANPSTSPIFLGGYLLDNTLVHDINRDGRSDIVAMIANYTQPAMLVAALSNGDGTFTTLTTPVASDPEGNGFSYIDTQPALADFNKDGKLDAVYGGLNNVYVLAGNGDGTFATSGPVLPIPSLSGLTIAGAEGVAAGDFDGDGNQDFVVLVDYTKLANVFAGAQIPAGSAAWVYFGNGNGTFSAPVSAGIFNHNYTGIATGDFNLDGLADMVVKTSGSLGGGEALGVVHGQAGRTFGPEINYTGGAGLSNLSIADLNRDGYPDLVIANGDYNDGAPTVTILINSGTLNTTETLTSSLNPSILTNSVTFTAQLSSTTGTPTGDVQFIDGTTVLATQTISGTGASTYTTSALAIGSHPITASYQPTGAFSATSASLTQVVNPYPTTVNIACSPPIAQVGDGISVYATVSSTYGTPSGIVSFINNGTALGQATLNNNLALFNYVAQSAGPQTITVTYPPTGNFAGGSASCTVNVTALPTTSTLTVTPTTSTYGSSVTLTATVVPTTPPGPSTPAGTVTFYNGTTALGTVTLNAAAVATLPLSNLPAGSDSLTCTYSGSAIYAASNCNTVAANITIAPTALTLTSSLNPAPAFTPVTFTMQLTVNGQPAGAGYAITLGMLSACTNNLLAQLASLTTDATGTVTFTTSSLPVGSDCLIANFGGDTNHSAATAGLTEVITAAPITLTLTAVPNPAYFTQNVTLNATVPAVSGSKSIMYPAGTITFLDAGVPIGTAMLNVNGAAMFSTQTLASGTHPLTATFAATGSYSSAISNTVQEVILTSTFTIVLAPTAVAVQAGQPTTMLVNLTSIGNFSGPLALTYGTLPAYATASIAPTTVTLSAGGSATAVLTLMTARHASNEIPSRPGRRALPVALAALGLLLLLPARRRRFSRLLTLLLAALALQSVTGCTNRWYELELVTPGTYQLPITATDMNQNARSATLSVTVTP